MARINKAPKFTEKTHEGAPAARMNTEQALRRSVLSCLLWEREFYEDGEEIGARIYRLAQELDPVKLSGLAVEARNEFNLRHVPLVLLSALAKTGKGTALVSATIAATIRRADELAELLAVHAKLNNASPKAMKKIISAQMKRGLALALGRFDEYQLAKYDRAGEVRLRDVLFLCHAKPKDGEQAGTWARLAKGELAVPDTWEVALSGGADKKETFERLIREGNLGYLALLRNLRNMEQSGVDMDLVKEAILARKNGAHWVLPFRYVAAARACPQLEPVIDQALCEALTESPVLPGKTIVLVDVSGSMDMRLSAKSDLTRMDAAAALASMINGDRRVFTFSNRTVEVAPRFGMAGVDAIRMAQEFSGTRLGEAVTHANSLPHDRLIVITDEQSASAVPNPVAKRAYMINVASAKNGVGYGKWTHLDGFSEAVLRYIRESEAAE